MRRKSTRGMAAIIDSLVFVLIISVISFLILESPNDAAERGTWDRSSMFHSVLVHSTIPTMSSADGRNGSEASVSDLLRRALSSGDQALIAKLSAQLDPIADFLVTVPYHYQWAISRMNEQMVMGESSVPDGRDVSASKIELGEGITSIFYLWIL